MATRKRLKVEYLPLSELEHWPKNPKKHDTEGIKGSIRRFGFAAPVVIDERTKRLVAGHGRQEALSQMRSAGEDIPAHIAKRNGEWLVPVVRGNEFESEEEAERYLIADNQRDKAKKGRAAKGESNGAAKLTPIIVREIHRRLRSGEMKSVLAREFGVTRTAIYYIAKGKNWRHVKG